MLSATVRRPSKGSTTMTTERGGWAAAEQPNGQAYPKDGIVYIGLGESTIELDSIVDVCGGEKQVRSGPATRFQLRATQS